MSGGRGHLGVGVDQDAGACLGRPRVGEDLVPRGRPVGRPPCQSPCSGRRWPARSALLRWPRSCSCVRSAARASRPSRSSPATQHSCRRPRARPRRCTACRRRPCWSPGYWTGASGCTGTRAGPRRPRWPRIGFAPRRVILSTPCIHTWLLEDGMARSLTRSKRCYHGEEEAPDSANKKRMKFWPGLGISQVLPLRGPAVVLYV